MIIKNCEFCRNEFETYPSLRKKCCSVICSQDLSKQKSYDKYKVNCEICNMEFMPPRPKDGARFCSYACSGISMRKDRVDREGYWYKCVPDHQNASKQGYVAEHHLIMEAHIGRVLKYGEVVHHKNEDRKDNRIENLELMTDSAHKSLHAKSRKDKKNGTFITTLQKKRV